MLQFDLKIENIPFLVDERNHNIDAIEANWQKLKYWRKTYLKTKLASNNTYKETSQKDYRIILTEITDKIADLTIRNMMIDDLIWMKHLQRNQS